MLKRAIPFILTFTLGLAIASIFVSIVPRFEYKRSGKNRNHYNHHQIISDLQIENDQLKMENRRLRNEQLREMDAPIPLEELRDIERAVPPPMPIAPRRSR